MSSHWTRANRHEDGEWMDLEIPLAVCLFRFVFLSVIGPER